MIKDLLASRDLVRPGARLGHEVMVKAETGSTNDDAKALAEAGAGHGTVVIAEQQVRGRGRLGRQWSSPPGVNLLFSVALRDPGLFERAGLVTIAAGVGVTRAVRRLAGIAAMIKWPNDVRVARRKLCGILAEAGGAGRIEYIIVGIGLNVNLRPLELPDELREIATSLLAETGREWRRAEVFKIVLEDLETTLADLAAGRTEKVRQAWREFDELEGGRVRAETPAGSFTGRAKGLRDDGALLIEDDADGSERAVVAGNITVLD